MFDPETQTYVDGLLARCAFGAPGTPLACAVSGGVDSLALLILAVAHGCEVRAFHVDHGLRPGSHTEADAVSAAAERFGARFTSLQIRVEPGSNLEARARAGRYGVLPADVATGHTADDQAETVLLAMLRGSAWHGLGGMEPSRRRPLLRLRRSDTEELCGRVGLDPLVDPSNANPAFARNRVRHELLPLLNDIAQRDLVPVLDRQAGLFRQGSALLTDLAAELDPTDARVLAEAPEVLAREAVRLWVWQGGGHDHPPDLAAVDRVLAVARCDARATDVGHGWRVERSNMVLRLVGPSPTVPRATSD